MSELAYVNGRFLPIDEATVSIDDRGYQFGDGVYEVVYAFDRRPFLLDEHLARLAQSLDGLRIRGVAIDDMRRVIEDLARRGDPRRSKIYLSITRGVAPRNHIFPVDLIPTVVATVRPAGEPPAGALSEGISAITARDIRWGRCDLKTLNLLGNVIARQAAEEAGAQEAILVSDDGLVREGSSANVFLVMSGAVKTHPCDAHILPGITRNLVVRLARENGIEVREEAPPREDLFAADEIFVTGTVAELAAVTRLDGRRIGDGKPGPMTLRLRRLYDEYVQQFVARAANR
ncbi:D-amino-acid transaminase [bacterium]|nr:D-amino-acid transaminase [bacterium]